MNCEYNDHVCPALPEGIPEDRPYTLLLYHSGTFRFFLSCADSPFFAKTVDNAPVIALDPDTQLYVFVWTITDADWVSAGEVDVSELEVAQNSDWLYFNPEKQIYVWTNTDIVDDSGAVVYAASDPIPIIETDYLMSWLTGYILGISGKPYPFAKKKLVGYSYNGVVLPALPEEALAYPYRWIKQYGSWAYLYASDNAPRSFIGSTGSEYWGYQTGIDAADVRFIATIGDMEWESTGYNIVGNVSLPTWTNVDAYKLDGTLLLAASEPVPVYE